MAIQQNTGFRMMEGGLEDTPLTMSEDASRTAFDQVTSGISNLYQNMLQRSPDAGGLQYWVDQVNSGKATLNDVSNAFKGSTEFLGTQLRSLNSLWDAEVANQEQPGIQSDIKTGSVDFGGRNWTAFRSPDGGVQISTLNADQSGIGSGQYRADFLDPDTGEVTTRVLDRNKTTDRLGKVLIGTMAALIAAPQLAGSLFGTEAAAGLGADLAAGGLSAESLATLNAIGPGAVSEIIAGTGGLLDAGLAAGGLLSGGLSAETLAALDAVGQTAIPEIVNTTGGLLDAGLAATVPATVTPPSGGPSLTVTSTPLPPPSIIPPEIIAGGIGATTLLPTGEEALTDVITNTDKLITTPTTPTVVPPVVPPGTTPPGVTPTTPTNLFGDNPLGNLLKTIGITDAEGLKSLFSTGIDMAARNTAASELSKAQTDIRNAYKDAASGVNFTPYGVTTNLFGTSFADGAMKTSLSPDQQTLVDNLLKAAAGSAEQAKLTDVDTLAQDYYKKLAALSAPEQERQRLATEERLRSQGRLGVSGSAYGGTSPELLAMEQAIAQQQLQRELQSRQAALGERGTLLSQAQTAFTPLQQLSQQQLAAGQLGATLGQQAANTAYQRGLLTTAGQRAESDIAAEIARLKAGSVQAGSNVGSQLLTNLLTNAFTKIGV
jgi:hypothetical protein